MTQPQFDPQSLRELRACIKTCEKKSVGALTAIIPPAAKRGKVVHRLRASAF